VLNGVEISRVVSVAALLTIGSALDAAQLYRWEDGTGHVTYADRVPAEHLGSGRTEFAPTGLRIREVAPAPTAMELARQLELARMRREQQRLIDEQREADRVLLRSFPTEHEIILARDTKLGTIDINISVMRTNTKRIKQRLVDMQEELNAMLMAGDEPDVSFQSEMKSLRNQTQEFYRQILIAEEQKQKIRDKYARHQHRYRQLRNLAGADEEVPVVAEELVLDNVIACDGDQFCDSLWKRARVYVERNARTPVALSADAVLMTAPPSSSNELSITVSRIPRDAAAESYWIFLDLQCLSTVAGDAHCASEEVEDVRRGFRTAIIDDARRADELQSRDEARSSRAAALVTR
jgi:hypothetical protein